HGLTESTAPVLEVAPDLIIDEVQDRRLTAVVLETPGDATTVHAAALQRGLVVPDELSIISLGGWINRAESSPPIAGFRIPQQEIGRRAVRILVRLLTDPSRGPIQEIVPLIEDLDHTIAPPPQ